MEVCLLLIIKTRWICLGKLLIFVLLDLFSCHLNIEAAVLVCPDSYVFGPNIGLWFYFEWDSSKIHAVHLMMLLFKISSFMLVSFYLWKLSLLLPFFLHWFFNNINSMYFFVYVAFSLVDQMDGFVARDALILFYFKFFNFFMDNLWYPDFVWLKLMTRKNFSGPVAQRGFEDLNRWPMGYFPDLYQPRQPLLYAAENSKSRAT